MRKIYIAGAYSATDVITILDNIREGLRLSTEVFLAGFAPFSPWLDFHFQLMLRPGETLTIQNYLDYSMEWLRVSDAVLLVPGWQDSKGTKAEIQEAMSLGIGVFQDLEILKGWAN